MLKKLLCLGMLSTSAFMSAGLWQSLNEDPEKSLKVAALSEDRQEALRAACDASDAWQHEAQEKIMTHAQENPEGFSALQEVTGAAEIRVYAELVCVVAQAEEHRNITDADEAHAEEVREEMTSEAAA